MKVLLMECGCTVATSPRIRGEQALIVEPCEMSDGEPVVRLEGYLERVQLSDDELDAETREKIQQLKAAEAKLERAKAFFVGAGRPSKH